MLLMTGHKRGFNGKYYARHGKDASTQILSNTSDEKTLARIKMRTQRWCLLCMLRKCLFFQRVVQ